MSLPELSGERRALEAPDLSLQSGIVRSRMLTDPSAEMRLPVWTSNVGALWNRLRTSVCVLSSQAWSSFATLLTSKVELSLAIKKFSGCSWGTFVRRL